MDKLFFEERGLILLKRIGMSQVEFARQMGIRKQNVKVLLRTKNLETIRRAAKVMGVPFEMLISYATEPDIDQIPMPVPPEDILIDAAAFRSSPGRYFALAKTGVVVIFSRKYGRFRLLPVD